MASLNTDSLSLQKPLLLGNHPPLIISTSPLPTPTYASEPEPDCSGHIASRRSRDGKGHNYCKNCTCNTCQHRALAMRHKRLHRRNKKNTHKFKKKRDDKRHALERSSSANIWIKQLTTRSSTEDKQIHCMTVCKAYDFDTLCTDQTFETYRVFARYEDSIHFKLNDKQIMLNDNEDTAIIESIINDIDVFVFQDEGVIVFWNVDEANRYRFISFLETFQIKYDKNEQSETNKPQKHS
eukprot:158748_1